MPDLLLALDQGTTSSRAILFDAVGAPVGSAQHEHPQSFPADGWVEHDPEAIWTTQIEAARGALASAGASAADIAAVGITNQRETVVLWDRRTGKAIAPAIVWQDRRTADVCRRLTRDGAGDLVQETTGLLLDPYFSATKVAWLLDHVPAARRDAEAGRLAFGTVDAFLLWRLTAGEAHATDVSNASRTSLMNADTCEWDDGPLALFGVPPAILPAIRPTTGAFGRIAGGLPATGAPITALVGDQQSAAFGQACHAPGMAKNTYGTGAFLLLITGSERARSRARLLSTVAWRIADAPPVYALEGSIFVTGAAIQWLRDGLGIIGSADETGPLAASVPDSAGVTFVPAFVGLGAPHWDPNARGAIVGLTRGAAKAHVVRAALEAACFQTRDVLEAMAHDVGRPVEAIRADGGMAANDVLMQMQADLIGVPVHRPVVTETTALGAAWLAGIGAGLYRDANDAAALWRPERVFEPRISEDERDAAYARWKRAVAMVRLK